MKIKLITISLAISAWLLSPLSQADHHEFVGGIEVAAPFNLQVQMCTLADGVSQKQYDAFLNEFFAWTKKHDTEVTFIRQQSLFSHANASNPNPYDFVEFLATDHRSAGKAWDKWLTTKDGQKLGEKWSKLATCHVKMAHAKMIWANVEAMNTDRERVVTWNWCTRKNGVSWDQLNAKHDSVAAMVDANPTNIGWAAFFPNLGGANAPGEFAHIVVYPNVEALMENGARYTQGGWRMLDDYYTSYADCHGESASLETIMYQPGD